MRKNTARRVQLDLETLEARDVPSALSLGTAGGYAVLGLAKAGIVNFDSSVTGDEGVSKGGSLWNQRHSTITGDVAEFSRGEYYGHGKLGGTLSIDPTALNQADSDALSASTQAAALTATQTFKNITAPTTVTGDGGVNVIDITGDIRNSLILSGTASDVFVVNVKGSVALGGRETLGLAGGVTADHVLYNFIGSDGSVSARSGSVIDGTLLGPKYSFDLEGTIDGAIIAGRDADLVGAKVTEDSFTMPVTVTNSPGSLSGFALNSLNGAPIVKFTIDLEDSSGNILQSTTTSSTGAFSFTGLQPGTYQLVAAQNGNWIGISSTPGTVNGATDGTSVNSVTIGSIVLANGGAGINYDFQLGAGG
jgi:Carboxypeptidase regulatory-like domain